MWKAIDYKEKIKALEAEEIDWPYPARRLRSNEAEQVSLLLTGLREKHQIPFLIVNHLDLLQDWQDSDETEDFFISCYDDLRLYPEFCRYLQEEIPGGRRLCQESTLKTVKLCLGQDIARAKPGQEPPHCHLGLRNIYQPIFFEKEKRPLAYCASGKFCFPEDLDVIEKEINGLRRRLPGIEEKHLMALFNRMTNLEPKIKIISPNEITELEKKIKNSILSLTKILKTKYLKNKRDFNRYFREEIEDAFDQIKMKGLLDLPPKLNKLFESVWEYLGVDYIAIFISNRPESHLLDLVRQCGLHGLVRTDITFNLKKANLKNEDIAIQRWAFPSGEEAARELKKGIRGIKKTSLADMSYLFPFAFAEHYGGVILGPFGRRVDVNKEREYLNRLCYTIGLHLCNQAVINTLKQEKRDRELVVALVSHTVRHNLDTVKAELGEIKYEVGQIHSSPHHLKVFDAVGRSENGIDLLVRSCQTALDAPDAAKAISLGLQEQHLNFQPLTIYELLAEREKKYTPLAVEKIKEIRLDDENDTLLELPGIMADRELLGLALDNLLENAIKYTGKNHYVHIKGKEEKYANLVTISIHNKGLEIKEDEMESIFEVGIRGEAAKLYRPEGGHGLGLQIVRRIIELHQGYIGCTCTKQGDGEWDYLTTFTITLPTIVGFRRETKKCRPNI